MSSNADRVPSNPRYPLQGHKTPGKSPLRWKSLKTRLAAIHNGSSTDSSPAVSVSDKSSGESVVFSDYSSDGDGSATPATDPNSDPQVLESIKGDVAEVDVTRTRPDHASTKLLTKDPEPLKEAVGDSGNGAELIKKYCCGGGCCFQDIPAPVPSTEAFTPLDLPENDAFRSLDLKLGHLNQETELTNVTPLPTKTASFSPASASQGLDSSQAGRHPPSFVQPHPPHSVFSAPLLHARELTKPGAEKRTYHFDIDVTDYPAEGDVDFKVGGAIGVCPPNSPEMVDEIFDLLGVPRAFRDKPVSLETSGGRWPTIWGEEASRSLASTRRELLTWCSDIQSYPPTKNLFRLMGEHATSPAERKILLYLSSAQGQAAFCEIRTGPHLSLIQLLHAFPSSRPPLDHVISVLSQLMPRFYSLSNDPYVSSDRESPAKRRIIEVAVTVHESPNWHSDEPRTGAGSGFLERQAHKLMRAEAERQPHPDLRIPMFRGLMSNPLSKEFGTSDGPMLLIGAGVGMAPFRGFILNRLRNANCASKIWLIQGVRDSNLDELYSGELGKYEADIKKVVQSRAGSFAIEGGRLPKTPAKKEKLPMYQLCRGADAESKNYSETDLAALRPATSKERLKPATANTESAPSSRPQSFIGTADTLKPLEPPSSASGSASASASTSTSTSPPASLPSLSTTTTADTNLPPLTATTTASTTKSTVPSPTSTQQIQSRYVQDELLAQATLVWSVIKSLDGRIFVCGSSKGMGEGVEWALREVARRQGGCSEEAAGRFWTEMREAGKLVVETW